MSFAELDIDHVIPESLANDATLSPLLEKLGLPPTFSLSSVQNLVPAHRKCNLAKSSDMFKDSSTRFFLHKAEQAAVNVQRIQASHKRRNKADELISTVKEAMRSGLILPVDLQEADPPDRLRLSRPLLFADRPEEPIVSISPCEVEAYLDRPILIGGNPSFSANFGDEGGVRITVRTCREYCAAMAAGFYALSTYDIKSEAFLKVASALLAGAESVRIPLISYIRSPHLGVPDLHLFPPSMLPCVSPDDERAVADLGNVSLADLLARREIKIIDVSSNEISLEWHWGLMVREVCRADFDGDGIEDILCECYLWAPEGTLGFGWTNVLSRKSAEAGFSVSEL